MGIPCVIPKSCPSAYFGIVHAPSYVAGVRLEGPVPDRCGLGVLPLGAGDCGSSGRPGAKSTAGGPNFMVKQKVHIKIYRLIPGDFLLSVWTSGG